MSLTKLSLTWNKLLLARENLVIVTSRLGTGKSLTFFTVYVPEGYEASLIS